MQVPDVLLPLAGSLSQCDWTATGIETPLRQRLPRTWKRIPVLMTQDLLASFPGQTAPDPARVAQSLRASPHAHRLLAHARKTGTLPAPWLHPPTFRPIPALAALPLPRLTTPEDLSDWLALPPDQLIRFTDPHGLSARNPTRFARHATAAQRQTVTGLTVNAHVNIPRDSYDRLKATLHHLARPEDPRRADPAFPAASRARSPGSRP